MKCSSSVCLVFLVLFAANVGKGNGLGVCKMNVQCENSECSTNCKNDYASFHPQVDGYCKESDLCYCSYPCQESRLLACSKGNCEAAIATARSEGPNDGELCYFPYGCHRDVCDRTCKDMLQAHVSPVGGTCTMDQRCVCSYQC